MPPLTSMNHYVQHLTPQTTFILGASTALLLATFFRAYTTDRSNRVPTLPAKRGQHTGQPPIIPSPLETTIPNLTPSSLSQLAYPPTHALLPGARDLQTPYGTMRIYEFGNLKSASAHKVLFLPGISTPCISLAGIAHQLISLSNDGVRVMLIDLFGRGYSSGPADLPYDGRLSASQIYMAIASSQAHWDRFSVVGYSLGGCFAADFASWFPEKVRECVLLAPGGLVREGDISIRSKILYSKSGLVPEAWLREAVRRRLKGPSRPEGRREDARGDQKIDLLDASKAEIAERQETEAGFDMQGAVDWQLENHRGFVYAYMQSIRYAPIHGQHERWRLIGQRQKGNSRQAFDSRKLMLVLGETDSIVKPKELVPDAEEVVGAENMSVHVVKGAGHEVPITHARQCAQIMWDAWSGADN